jgi:hypothetical protein
VSEKKRGRPKSDPDVKRVTMTIRLDQWAVEWVENNLPRSVSVSAFAREAMQKEIARLQAEGATPHPAPQNNS